ncbi:ABC-2 type transporter [Parasponia andersonii]|uniref:ABC-2 type transporter n=1 Tax=Parasponia andersonii TaxID=3476 RepID=A0A2P5DS02_PARAD|nr:ABC-2 type transporter [Parasponia andersonii]
MNVLAGRKTGGYIEGSISISGYQKNQATFARISDVKKETRKMFVEEVMELIELKSLRKALVGLTGVNGLTTEQRKRLTIVVELVANPSIIFMDEPTSGLDARAAATVMRTMRNTVDTGRTVVCTIHQPSIDIFEAFDEIKEGYNPATWVLEVSSNAVEVHLGIDFAQVYAHSDLYPRNEEVIKQLSTPQPGSKDLYFPTKYSQSFMTQCKAYFWKQHRSYWRNSHCNAIRFFMTIVIGILFGQRDLSNLLGVTYSAVLFLGDTNTSAVQSVVAIERTVFCRERAAGMYSELPYAFAQLAIETIYVAVQTLVYSLLLYSMIGFQWNVDKFFYFFYFIFTCFTYFSMYGMMVVALTPGHEIAAIVVSFFLSFWNLFSGFLIPRPLFLAHVGWVLLFFLVFAYGIKFLNFQRR